MLSKQQRFYIQCWTQREDSHEWWSGNNSEGRNWCLFRGTTWHSHRDTEEAHERRS